MRTVKIHAPIWKTRSIGIAEYKLCKDIRIEIDYKTKEGKRLYPGKYTISREKALTYPIQRCGSVTLRIIPIDDLEPIISPARRSKKRFNPENIPELNELPGEREVIGGQDE